MAAAAVVAVSVLLVFQRTLQVPVGKQNGILQMPVRAWRGLIGVGLRLTVGFAAGVRCLRSPVLVRGSSCVLVLAAARHRRSARAAGWRAAVG